MIYVPDTEIERFLLEDIAFGDVTSRSLKLEQQTGQITFFNRQASIVSGLRVVKRLFQKLDLDIIQSATDGQALSAEQILIQAQGNAAALYQAWKVAQNILEWSCGVAQASAELVNAARQMNPQIQIACTRKSIPGTRLLATMAILDGGAIIHRIGTTETILVFANHRRFLPQPLDWALHVRQLRQQAPEKKIVLEADNMEEALAAMLAKPDIVQLDKFSPDEIRQCIAIATTHGYTGSLIAAGGIHQANVKDYAATGVNVLVTSAPYYAKPADIRVVLSPLS